MKSNQNTQYKMVVVTRIKVLVLVAAVVAVVAVVEVVLVVVWWSQMLR